MSGVESCWNPGDYMLEFSFRRHIRYCSLTQSQILKYGSFFFSVCLSFQLTFHTYHTHLLVH